MVTATLGMKEMIKYNEPMKKAAKIGLVLLLLYLVVHHCTSSKAPAFPVPAVIVKKPILANMVEYITQTGTTVAYNSVDLVARVEGYLDKLEFIDGTQVKKDTELFVIQPDTYMEQLKVAQAQIAISKAEFEYSKSEYARQQRMYKQNATSLNNVESWFAKTHEAEGEVAKAIANAEIAKINYSYTHVKAPFDGRIGRHLVSVGNLVGNGVATNIATIEQIDPLYVYFNVNEIDLLKLRAAARAQGIKDNDLGKIPVTLALQNGEPFKYKASLDFYNTGLNASTGTMELRALLENKDAIFVPGLFIQVRVAITKPTPQLTVPDTAILYDQIGSYVYVVDDKNIVVLKRVKLGALEQGMRAVVDGLDKNSQVVVEGTQNATPGGVVSLRTQ